MSTTLTLPPECTTLYVGLELAQRTLVARAVDWHRQDRGQLTIANSPTGLKQLCAWLTRQLAALHLTQVHLGMEATNQYWMPVRETLQQRATVQALPLTLVVLNPRKVQVYKDSRLTPQKTDPLDARAIALYLRAGEAPTYTPIDAQYLALRQLTRYRHGLIGMLVQEKNRCLGFLFRKGSGIRQHPPIAKAFAATNRAVFTAVPELQDLLDWSPETFMTQLTTWSRGHLHDVAATVQAFRTAIADSYPVPEPLVEPLDTCLTVSFATLDHLAAQIRTLDAQIATALAAFPEAAWLRAIPGFGPVFTAGVVAEIADITRFADHAALAHYVGLLWTSHQSGDCVGTATRRIATGNSDLRYYLVEGANSVRVHTEEFATYYRRKRAEGATYAHQRALLFTARKLVRVIWYCLTNHTPYCLPEARPGRKTA